MWSTMESIQCCSCVESGLLGINIYLIRNWIFWCVGRHTNLNVFLETNAFNILRKICICRPLDWKEMYKYVEKKPYFCTLDGNDVKLIKTIQILVTFHFYSPLRHLEVVASGGDFMVVVNEVLNCCLHKQRKKMQVSFSSL